MSCDRAASRSLRNVEHFIRNGDLDDARREVARVIRMVERMERERGVHCECSQSDFTRVRWGALTAARAKCRKNVVEAERSGDSDRIHTAYKLSSFLAEAFPDAWNAVEDRVPDVIPDA